MKTKRINNTMAPIQRYFEFEGWKQSYYQWGDPGDPTILLLHATGMHGRVWDKTIEALPAGLHIIAIDQRGHGNSLSDDYLLDWRILGQDLSRFITGLDLTNIIGVGHSMGGHALTQAVLLHPDRFCRLVLIDPVIFAPQRYEQKGDFENIHPTSSPIARRRNGFSNWQEMKSIFSVRVPYCHWVPEILDNYCRYGLVQNQEEEGFGLACRPDVEASVYLGHCSVNLLDDIPNIKIPTTVLRAKDRDPNITHKIDFSASPTWEKLADLFPNGKDVPLKHLTHFIPMQEPALVANYITDDII